MKRLGFLLGCATLLGVMSPSLSVAGESKNETLAPVSQKAPAQLHDVESDLDYKTVDVLVDYQGRKKGGLYPCVYSEDVFFRPSTTYHHFLARQSIGLALSAFHLYEDEEIREEGDAEEAEGTLFSYFRKCGYFNIRVDDYLKETSLYTVGSAIARKVIEKDGEKADLVAVGIRGGNYKNEWQSNLTLDTGSRHRGFDEAATLVTDRILSYLAQHVFEHPVKIWITGFSRAAAVANLVAANLNDSDVLTKEQIYAYTFAAPRPLWAFEGMDLVGRYNNIFNIYGASDFIPQFVPAEWHYYHYGIDKMLTGAEFDSKFASKYAVIQENLKNEGVETYYNIELNLRVRMLYGLLLEIATNEFEFMEYLQPVLLKVLRLKGINEALSLLRETILEWTSSYPEISEKRDAVIDFAIETLRPLFFGGGYMEGQKNTSRNPALFLAHEHFPELYLHSLYDIPENELFCGSSEFAYITLKGGRYKVVDLDAGKDVMFIENGSKRLTPYGEENDLDLPVVKVRGTPLLVLPYDRNYELRYELSEGETSECYVQPYGRLFSSHLTKYVSKIDQNDPRSGVILTINNGTVAYQATGSASNPTEFVRQLNIQSGLLPYRVYVFVVGLVIGLLITGLLWLVVIVHARVARRKISFLRLGLLSLFIVSLIEGEISFWFFADLVYVGVLAKVVAALVLLVLYFLGRKLRDFRRPDKTILPFLLLALSGNIVLSVNFPVGLGLIVAGLGFLCFRNLREKRMKSNQWFIFGILTVLLLVCAALLLRPLDASSILFLCAIPAALLYCFSSFKGSGQKEVASFVTLIALAVMAPYLYGSVQFVSSVLFVVLFNAAMVIHALYYDAPKFEALALERPEPAVAEETPAEKA